MPQRRRRTKPRHEWVQSLEARRLMANLGEVGLYLVDHATGLPASDPYVGQHVEVRATFVAEGLSPGTVVRVQRETVNGVLYSEVATPASWGGREVVERSLFTWTVPPTDAWVSVTVDPRGLVGETSESDNTFTLALTPRAGSIDLGVPAYHSLPGARYALYLDFDGNYQEQFAGSRHVTTPAYDTDGAPLLLSAAEREEIRQIWARVAEDYAPFEINVTTEAPRDGHYERFQRVAIGGASCDWYQFSAAGTALAGSFYEMDARSAAFVFIRQANGDGTSTAFPLATVADAASHEAGHAFGLWHQAQYVNEELIGDYHPGTGQWGPIMGRSGNAVSTWHFGPTHESATAYQDDMAVLSNGRNGFGYRADDVGNDVATATPLVVDGRTYQGAGIIETMADVDVFSATLAEGRYRFAVNVVTDGPNLDAVLELRDASGAVIASADPADAPSAAVEMAVAAGTYYLTVRSTGAYGRVGQYRVAIGEPAAPSGPAPNPPVATGPAADLAVSLTGRPPKSVTTGTKVSVTAAVSNVGDVGSKGPVTVKVYASRDGELSADAVLLGKAVIRQAIARGTHMGVSVPVAYPKVLGSGTYHMVLTVEGRGAERSAENNVAAGTAPVRVMRVAPRLTGAVVPLAVRAAQRPWVATVTVRNQGNQAFAGMATVKVFASRDGIFGNEDDVLVGRVTTSVRLGVGATADVAVRAKALADAGTYNVFTVVTQGGESVAARRAVKVRFG